MSDPAKTTKLVRIPNTLARELKARAALDGRTLASLVEELLKRALDGAPAQATHA